MQGMEQRLRTEMNWRFEGVDQQFHGMGKRFDVVDQRLNRLERKVDLLSIQIHTIDSRLDDIEVVQLPALRQAVGIR